jgi:hypothetical protein
MERKGSPMRRVQENKGIMSNQKLFQTARLDLI